MKKKVIFIGGTLYSGSTFFDMILANDAHGFSCGEVYALFYPFRPHHYDPACGCGHEKCRLWNQVLASGVDNLYQSIFETRPDVDFIIDSSKNPFWIKKQNRLLRSQGIGYKNILIWKTPLEFALSYKKRGLSNWDTDWVKEHRLFFSCLSEWTTIPYSQLANSPEALEAACKYLDIGYTPSKQRFWEKEHHTLFGNNSAKISLFEKSSQRYVESKDKLSPDYGNGEQRHSETYRQITYSNGDDAKLENEVAEKLGANRSLQQLFSFLSALTPLMDSSIGNQQGAGYPFLIYTLKGFKQSLRMLVNGSRRRRYYGF